MDGPPASGQLVTHAEPVSDEVWERIELIALSALRRKARAMAEGRRDRVDGHVDLGR
jgi:hypothetical protein